MRMRVGCDRGCAGGGGLLKRAPPRDVTGRIWRRAANRRRTSVRVPSRQTVAEKEVRVGGDGESAAPPGPRDGAGRALPGRRLQVGEPARATRGEVPVRPGLLERELLQPADRGALKAQSGG